MIGFATMALLWLGLPACDMLVSGDAKKERAARGKSKGKGGADGDGSDDGIPGFELDKDYTYNPIGKRDPFRSFLSGAGGGGQGDLVPRTPLQRYDLDEYALVGIVWGIERPRALVEDPTGVGHVMEVGTYIGKNWGKVTEINGDEVVITEEYQTIDGELVVNPIRMVLPVKD